MATAAERMRKSRDLRRRGRMPLRIDVADVDWPMTLVELGYLPMSKVDDPAAIAKSTIAFLDRVSIGTVTP